MTQTYGQMVSLYARGRLRARRSPMGNPDLRCNQLVQTGCDTPHYTQYG